MNTLNLNIIRRNLWKRKWFVIFNIAGLSIGFSCFIIISLYISYENNFDKWTPALKQVYRVGLHKIDQGNKMDQAELPGYVSEALKTELGEVNGVGRALLGATGSKLSFGEQTQEFNNWLIADSSFIKMYPLSVIKGAIMEAISEPGSAAISLTKARQVFGDADPIGKVLKLNDPNANSQYTVKAIWDDRKNKSFYNADIITGLSVNVYGTSWKDMDFITMVQARDESDFEALAKKTNDKVLILSASKVAGSDFKKQLTTDEASLILKEKAGITDQKTIIEPLNQLNIFSYFSPSPKKTTMLVLTVLALVIVLLSCINFTNLAVAQSSDRAKEIGIRKVLGAQRFYLFLQFLLETAIQCVFAFILALFVSELLLDKAAVLLETKLELWGNPDFASTLSYLLFLLIVVIILAGFYPATVMSGMMPSTILKGNFSTGRESLLIRKILLVFQFMLAGILMICFVFINHQLEFIKTKDLGMKIDRLMVISVQDFGHKQNNESQFLAIKERLKRIPGVTDVTRSTNNPIGPTLALENFIDRGKEHKFSTIYSDLNYFNVLSSKIIQGRNFDLRFKGTDSSSSVILNESAYRSLSKPEIGQRLQIAPSRNFYTLIGVVKNIQTEGFEKEIAPTAYLNTGTMKWKSRVIIRFNSSDLSQTKADILNEWQQIEPRFSPVYHFVNDRFDKLNYNYDRLNKSVFIFGLISLFISLLGLFSLAAYSIRIKRKEIGLRIVLGASFSDIITLLNFDFIKLVLISALAADLLAFFMIYQWFKTFVYRIDLGITPFLLINGSLVFITIIVITLLGWKAAKSEPSIVLKAS